MKFWRSILTLAMCLLLVGGSVLAPVAPAAAEADLGEQIPHETQDEDPKMDLLEKVYLPEPPHPPEPPPKPDDDDAIRRMQIPPSADTQDDVDDTVIIDLDERGVIRGANAALVGAAITAAIDQQLLDLINQHAETYYKPEWDITLEQYKAWIATIAWGEGMLGGYVAHSGVPGVDLFFHRYDNSFRFCTGIGPFQIDRGGEIAGDEFGHWHKWPTIEKLKPERAVRAVLKWHYARFQEPGSTLSDFANHSVWFAVNPYEGGKPEEHWQTVTGTDWNAHKNTEQSLDWGSIKSQMAENAENHPTINFTFDYNVRDMGMVRWNIPDEEGVKTDTQKSVVFDGNFRTWLIFARWADGIIYFEYYYTYCPDREIEVWVWNDPDKEFRHIFVRGFYTTQDLTEQFPEHKEGNVAGVLLTSPAIVLCPPVLQLNWKHSLQPHVTRMQFGASPAIADLDINNVGDEASSDLEIVTGSDEFHNFYPELNATAWGIWRTFDSQGNIEWARDTLTDEARSSVAIVDIDGDGYLEIAGGTTSGWCVQVMDRFGNFMWTFPYPPQTGGPFMWHSSPAVAEIDPLVSGLELVIGNHPYTSVWAFDGDNSDGVDDGITLDTTMYPWADGTEGIDWDVLWVFETDGSVISTPAIGDIDNDGDLDVVFGCGWGWGIPGGRIYALDGRTGALLWVYQTDGTAVDASAALADFDNDGDLEVVIGSNDGRVYFIDGDENADGIINPDEVVYFQTGGPVHSSAAVGDLDLDGKLEIVVGSNDGNVYSFQYDPAGNTITKLWAFQTLGAVYSSPALANRHGDATLDIYVGSEDGYLYLIDGPTGTLIDAFHTDAPIRTSPSVADVDGDGMLDVFFTSWNSDDIDVGDIFWSLEDTGSVSDPYAPDWPMFRQNPYRTGAIEPVVIDLTPIQAALDRYQWALNDYIIRYIRAKAESMALLYHAYRENFGEVMIQFFGYRAGVDGYIPYPVDMPVDLIDVTEMATKDMTPEKAYMLYRFLDELFGSVELDKPDMSAQEIKEEIKETFYKHYMGIAPGQEDFFLIDGLTVIDFIDEVNSVLDEKELQVIENLQQQNLTSQDITMIADMLNGRASHLVEHKTHSIESNFQRFATLMVYGEEEVRVFYSVVQYAVNKPWIVSAVSAIGTYGGKAVFGAGKALGKTIGCELIDHTMGGVTGQVCHIITTVGGAGHSVYKVSKPVWTKTKEVTEEIFRDTLMDFAEFVGSKLIKPVTEEIKKALRSHGVIVDEYYVVPNIRCENICLDLCPRGRIGKQHGWILVRNTGDVPFIPCFKGSAIVKPVWGLDGPVRIRVAGATIRFLGPWPKIEPGHTAAIHFYFTAPIDWVKHQTFLLRIQMNYGWHADVDYIPFTVVSAEKCGFITSCTIGDGVICTGEYSTVLHIPDEETEIITFTMTYSGSNLNLHLYDEYGRHVGICYDTGQMEVGIPNAVHSGEDYGVERIEWIRVTDPAHHNFTVKVVAVEGYDVSYSIIASEIHEIPATLRVTPGQINISAEGGDHREAMIFIEEFGGFHNLPDVSLKALALVHQNGVDRIDHTNIQFSKNNFDVEAGCFVPVSMSLSIPDDALPGTYTGKIAITAGGITEEVVIIVDVVAPTTAASEVVHGLQLGLSLPKVVFEPGETIVATLSLINTTQDEISFETRTSQLFDLIIEGPGRERRWSDDKMFLTVITPRHIPPNEALSKDLSWEAGMVPGDLFLAGVTVVLELNGERTELQTPPMRIWKRDL